MMPVPAPAPHLQPQTVFNGLPPSTQAFYLKSMDVLDSAGVPYLVGGAYSLAYYAGIIRHTKDFDTFLKPQDVQKALDAFEAAGYRTEITHPHWVAKAFNSGEDHPDFIDLIYGSGNGLTAVDDDWFEHSVEGELFGRKVRLCPAEESVWSKSFIMERTRFDGADVLHLLRARGRQFNWDRLLERYKGYEQVLLAHLLLFTFVYPTEHDAMPDDVMTRLWQRSRQAPQVAEPVCRGTFLSWEQYQTDLNEWGMKDARLKSLGGPMTAEQIARWTATPK